MVISRYRPLVLCTKQLIHGTLDDDEVWTYQHVIAHITEVNGAQLQTNLFGKRYNLTWVARVQGNYNPDMVAFPIQGTDDENLKKWTVIQVRKHATRTDIYFADDREAITNELD